LQQVDFVEVSTLLWIILDSEKFVESEQLLQLLVFFAENLGFGTAFGGVIMRSKAMER